MGDSVTLFQKLISGNVEQKVQEGGFTVGINT